jgi:hypothetical protein
MKPSTITLLSPNRQNRVAFALARAPREFNPIYAPLAKNPSQFEAAAMAISVFWCCISARPGRLGRRGDVTSLRKAGGGASPAMPLAFELGSAVAEDQAKRENGLIAYLETL